ncbi:MAG TPA: HlyD family efflux transporter periplasmic adaptor subunit [Thermoanaerobaculia bacterium]|nr:HlyD family efflux transporter periplasmic adaptor subunit [Thermoanaerobaculia bacterium]
MRIDSDTLGFDEQIAGPEQVEEVGVAVLWLDAESPSRRLRSLLEERGWTFVQPAGAAALVDLVRARARTILCFGPTIAPAEIKSILDSLEQAAPESAYLNLVFAGTAALADYQELVDEDRLFYLCRVALSDREVFGLIEGAAGFLERSDNPAPAAESGRLPVDTLRRLALARDLTELTQIASAAAAQAVEAQRGRCCLFDSRRQAIWSPTEATSGESPAVGLVSFILRTGLPLCLSRIGDDPRFDHDLDDPEGEPHDRFLGTPVHGAAGEVAAVLLALRSAQEAPFEPREIAALEAAADQIGPYLLALMTAVAAETASAVTLRGPFREQALREREMSATRFEPLRLAPGWTRWTFWLTLAALAVVLLAVVVVRVPEYASGVAVIRGGGRIDVTATAGGTVASLAVAPQSRVRKGQLLLALHSTDEAANLKRLERELELKLVQRLQSPSDPVVAQDLVALRAERDLAASRLSEREVRAPADGEVSDVRVSPGQYLEAGQPVLSILDGSSPPSLVALLPGRYLSQLHPGMKLRLELPGHPYVYRWLVLDSAAEQVIGPAEARRLLGPVAGDAVSFEGPLAMVTAPLLSPTFEVAGQSYSFRDGMPSKAEVRVRSERLLFALLPALKSVWGKSDA